MSQSRWLYQSRSNSPWAPASQTLSRCASGLQSPSTCLPAKESALRWLWVGRLASPLLQTPRAALHPLIGLRSRWWAVQMSQSALRQSSCLCWCYTRRRGADAGCRSQHYSGCGHRDLQHRRCLCWCCVRRRGTGAGCRSRRHSGCGRRDLQRRRRCASARGWCCCGQPARGPTWRNFHGWVECHVARSRDSGRRGQHSMPAR